MADVLVDTSVWIEYLRRSSRPSWRHVLEDLIEEDSAVLIGPTIAEILVGARGERELRVIDDLARSVRRAETDIQTWIEAGQIGRQWREKGKTLSITDCVLAAVARRDALPLWTLDDDFEPLVAQGFLRRFASGR